MIKNIIFDLSEVIISGYLGTEKLVGKHTDILEEEFAKAKIAQVVEKKFKELDKQDLEGHEKFSSKEEMYKTYSEYYHQTVDENTLVKIIKFELM